MKYVEERFIDEIAWYARNIRKVRSLSRPVRGFAIVFTALGGLVPVLMAGGWRFGMDPGAFGQLGYLSLALAGACVAFDKYFGLSTSWMRDVAAMIALEKLREGFRLEWLALSRRVSAGDVEAIGRMLDLAKSSVLKAKEISEKETEAWIGEFKSNLAALEKDLRGQADAQRPGGIEIRINTAEKAADGYEVRLDQQPVEKTAGKTASIAPVSPGLHKVAVLAKVNGVVYAASSIANVKPGEIVSVDVDLGIA